MGNHTCRGLLAIKHHWSSKGTLQILFRVLQHSCSCGWKELRRWGFTEMHKTKPTILWQLNEGSWKHLIPSQVFPAFTHTVIGRKCSEDKNSQKCKRELTILWQSQDQPNEYQFLWALNNRNIKLEQKLVTERDTLNLVNDLHSRLKQNPIASRDSPKWVLMQTLQTDSK